MTTHGPDDRLSAFYDGELSAAERAEVERLLNERLDLQAELNGLSDLSQRLSELADEVPEFDLRPQLLQQIANTRRLASPTLASNPSGGRRRWMPLLLTACSLSLLVAALLPLLTKTDQSSMVAMNAETQKESLVLADAKNLHRDESIIF